MRDTPIGDYAWDSSDKNNWETASLNAYLNGDTEGNYYYGLSSVAKRQIDSSIWYLGAITSNYTIIDGNGIDTTIISAEYLYNQERKNTAAKADGSVKSTTEKLGLLYPSDYVYTYAYGVDETCFEDSLNCHAGDGISTNGWIYNALLNRTNDYQFYFYWLASPYSYKSYYASMVHKIGAVYYTFQYVTEEGGVAPVTYLKSDIKTTGGDGSSKENAYVLENPSS